MYALYYCLGLSEYVAGVLGKIVGKKWFVLLNSDIVTCLCLSADSY